MGEYERCAVRVSLITIAVNTVLSAGKLWAGIWGQSGAMVSDAVHSLSDILSTLVVIVGVRLAARASDDGHPYGHERLECVAAILLAVMLAATGAIIGWQGIERIANGRTLAVPSAAPLFAAVLSIAVKEGMYWFTRAAAKRIGSGSLMADAWHHRSDALSSVGSFVGILGARLGAPVLDPVASVIICLFIVKAAWSIFMNAVRKMIDEAWDAEHVAALRSLAAAQRGVLGIDSLRTRVFGEKVYVDVELRADGRATLADAHAVAQQVHDCIENTYPEIKHCMIHVNPELEEAGATVQESP